MSFPDSELALVADTWLELGLSTQPADRATAETAALRAYEIAGLTPPQHVVWLDSPLAGAYAVAMLRADAEVLADSTALSTSEGAVDLWPGLRARVRESLLAQGCDPAGTSLGRSVRAQVRTRPWAQARAALVERLGPVGFARHWAATARRPWQQLIEQIVTPMRRRLEAQFAAEGKLGRLARESLLDAVFGQHDAAWLGAFTSVGADDAVKALADVADSAGWWWPYAEVLIMTERPDGVERDNLGRLHTGDGPALSYRDGFGLHCWRGMPIPPEVVPLLGRLSVELIQSQDNAEVRRVMLEHFGFERYLKESNAKKVHSDETGILWRITFPNDEPLVMVEVINSTPEPDGSRRTYFLRVPPSITTARAGVAWTFDVDPEDYEPLIQT